MGGDYLIIKKYIFHNTFIIRHCIYTYTFATNNANLLLNLVRLVIDPLPSVTRCRDDPPLPDGHGELGSGQPRAVSSVAVPGWLEECGGRLPHVRRVGGEEGQGGLQGEQGGAPPVGQQQLGEAVSAAGGDSVPVWPVL